MIVSVGDLANLPIEPGTLFTKLTRLPLGEPDLCCGIAFVGQIRRCWSAVPTDIDGDRICSNAFWTSSSRSFAHVQIDRAPVWTHRQERRPLGIRKRPAPSRPHVGKTEGPEAYIRLSGIEWTGAVRRRHFEATPTIGSRRLRQSLRAVFCPVCLNVSDKALNRRHSQGTRTE
jgi:hypothetical protein